jgi:ribosome-binding factor A
MVRVNELLRREIGEALFRIMSEANFDLSAVTITHVVTSRNLRNARVLVSIRDHEAQREAMLNLLRRHRGEIQSRINKNLILKYTPCLTFELDTSVEQGDRVLSLLSQLGDDEEAPPSPTDAGTGSTDSPSRKHPDE